jgi:hypothetical protein
MLLAMLCYAMQWKDVTKLLPMKLGLLQTALEVSSV